MADPFSALKIQTIVTRYQKLSLLPFHSPCVIAPSCVRYFHASHARNTGTRKSGHNPNRGISPLRRTGIEKSLRTLRIGDAVERDGLPQPVDIAEFPKLAISQNHGLWQFFNDKKLLTDPVEEQKHGRSWTLAECRLKSFSQLHQLWYACVKERNRMATENETRARLFRASSGEKIFNTRDKTIRGTMKAVKWALTERWYAWEDAWELAQTDPKIDLGEQPAYLPKRNKLNQKEQKQQPEESQMS